MDAAQCYAKVQGGRNLDHDGDNQGVGFVVSPGRKALFGTKETVAHVKDCCAKYRWKFPPRGEAW